MVSWQADGAIELVSFVCVAVAPTPQNGQTHSNNSNCLSVFEHLMGLALKGLTNKYIYKYLQC